LLIPPLAELTEEDFGLFDEVGVFALGEFDDAFPFFSALAFFAAFVEGEAEVIAENGAVWVDVDGLLIQFGGFGEAAYLIGGVGLAHKASGQSTSAEAVEEGVDELGEWHRRYFV